MHKHRSFLIAATLLVFAVASHAGDLPDDFPSDIPVAEHMDVYSVSGSGKDFSVSLRASGKSVKDLVAWFKDAYGAAGWTLAGEAVSATSAELPFGKDGRLCSVSITDSVMTNTGKLDRATKGITLEISEAPMKLDLSSVTSGG